MNFEITICTFPFDLGEIEPHTFDLQWNQNTIFKRRLLVVLLNLPVMSSYIQSCDFHQLVVGWPHADFYGFCMSANNIYIY
ncbi:MAG: hypothetical protein ACKPKO_41290, partial [Candidatus Fonsibacter sp.]